MKAIIIYSGKGGVGKTTTTANIARLLAKQGNKVFIIDADINTPSMNTEFEGDHPHEMIWVHSSGNMGNILNWLKRKYTLSTRIMFLLTRLQVLQTCI
ncbi:hypothetical protein GAIMETA21S07_26510 [Phocaeicola vulgatus]|uniref:nucleotide-binding protein n=1 Tax=Phocaeicola vulgatus TaxID=821 RepID=UPI001E29CAAE|nr:P-loop NTPase [Phocaeicola vulgatus]BDC10863.1 hypothetical protein GAIMETA21S07_26510 [Phocaeicola vulgatus]BDC15032.1 hypothetical protein GAIMETA21S10_27960 [Phocaeicola vulgatus]